MNFRIISAVVLIAVGFFGAFRVSALLFGLFTTGVFLLFFDFRTNGNSSPLPSVPPTPFVTCPNCRFVLASDMAFCPQCGKKVREA